MKTKMEIEIDLTQVLKGANTEDVVAHYVNRDVDELLMHIPPPMMIRYILHTTSRDFILNELAEVGDLETHISELRMWDAKQKSAKEVAS